MSCSGDCFEFPVNTITPPPPPPPQQQQFKQYFVNKYKNLYLQCNMICQYIRIYNTFVPCAPFRGLLGLKPFICPESFLHRKHWEVKIFI